MAQRLKLLTISDGFGDSECYPSWYPDYYKWPFILSLMTRNIELTNLSRYGAGNEFMVNLLREHHKSADVVLVQWTMPHRLDLMLAHSDDMQSNWRSKIKQDPVYNKNFQYTDDAEWWLSSASDMDRVQQYHSEFISKKQHRARSKIWIEYAHQILGSQVHGFLLTYNSDYLKNVDVDNNTWVWHEPWKGMDNWRHISKYEHLDFGYIQPIPLIHFEFIKKFIMPKFDLPWRSEKEIKAVEQMLIRKYNQYIEQKPL